MAIVVTNTEVISNTAKLVNITGATGRYDSFHPNVETMIPSSSTATVSMTFPFVDITIGQNTTITVSDKSAGRTSVIILDTALAPYTPTFDANVKWPADSQPVWSDHRYWNIALVCWDSTTVRAAAVGYDD